MSKNQHGGTRVPSKGKSLGRKPHPFPKKQRHTLKLRAPMWERLEKETARRGCTVNVLVESFIEDGLKTV